MRIRFDQTVLFCCFIFLLQEVPPSSGSKRWVSQWASLAANHTRHDQEDRIMELSVPVPLENGIFFLCVSV